MQNSVNKEKDITKKRGSKYLQGEDKQIEGKEKMMVTERQGGMGRRGEKGNGSNVRKSDEEGEKVKT